MLDLAGPPRDVPLLVRAKILFGGALNQFGWTFLGFGLIFVWAYTLHADLTSWYHFRGTLSTSRGTVLYSKETMFREERARVYAIGYSFVSWRGAKYEGVSYAVERPLKSGKSVTIEYPWGKPQISRIRGMQRKPVGRIGLLPLIFPLIGVFFMSLGVRKGLRANRLLAYGELTKGRLKSKVMTNVKVDEQRVYKLTFEFTTAEGVTSEVAAKTHQPEKLEDEAEEPLLYDPILPSNVVMLDSLPGSPRIDESGNIRTGSVCASLLSMVIPGVTVIGHIGYMCWKFVSGSS